jgi:uncharacterized membrane protein (DUF373 family)
MNMFAKVEKVIAIALLTLMTLVVISGTLEVGYEIVTSFIQPPGFFIGVSEFFDVFGLFLMVLIGLELMTSIHMYMENHNIHVEMMFLVALTAITRKIVILDSSNQEPLMVFAIGFLVIALSVGYYLLKLKNIEKEK